MFVSCVTSAGIHTFGKRPKDIKVSKSEKKKKVLYTPESFRPKVASRSSEDFKTATSADRTRERKPVFAKTTQKTSMRFSQRLVLGSSSQDLKRRKTHKFFDNKTALKSVSGFS